MHYGVEANDIGLDSHFSRLMYYEGDVLFIRDPITAEPYENDLKLQDNSRLRMKKIIL